MSKPDKSPRDRVADIAYEHSGYSDTIADALLSANLIDTRTPEEKAREAALWDAAALWRQVHDKHPNSYPPSEAALARAVDAMLDAEKPKPRFTVARDGNKARPWRVYDRHIEPVAHPAHRCCATFLEEAEAVSHAAQKNAECGK